MKAVWCWGERRLYAVGGFYLGGLQNLGGGGGEEALESRGFLGEGCEGS